MSSGKMYYESLCSSVTHRLHPVGDTPLSHSDVAISLYNVVTWPRGNGNDHINKVTLRWVTIRGYTVSVCNQPLRPTQLPALGGMRNEYRPMDSVSALWPGRYRRSGVALALHHRLCDIST